MRSVRIVRKTSSRTRRFSSLVSLAIAGCPSTRAVSFKKSSSTRTTDICSRIPMGSRIFCLAVINTNASNVPAACARYAASTASALLPIPPMPSTRIPHVRSTGLRARITTSISLARPKNAARRGRLFGIFGGRYCVISGVMGVFDCWPYATNSFCRLSSTSFSNDSSESNDCVKMLNLPCGS